MLFTYDIECRTEWCRHRRVAIGSGGVRGCTLRQGCLGQGACEHTKSQEMEFVPVDAKEGKDLD